MNTTKGGAVFIAFLTCGLITQAVAQGKDLHGRSLGAFDVRQLFD